MELFEAAKIGTCTLPNRILRSATYEGMCDEDGFPGQAYFDFYERLAGMQIGAIITGFAYISKQGKAMQPGQAGIDSVDKIPAYKMLTKKMHESNSRIFMQLAHAGRQSSSSITGQALVSSGRQASTYFRQKPVPLSPKEIVEIAARFGESAGYAKRAGFDGIQLHAAHGYLLHQFISPAINKRSDEFGPDRETGIGTRFLEIVVEQVRKQCGDAYPVLIKVSGGEDYRKGMGAEQFIRLIRFLNTLPIDAIEVSYGTMDYPLNIMRGDFPESRILKYNPFYKAGNTIEKFAARMFYFPQHKRKLKTFSPGYNLPFARLAKNHSRVPVISVGGFRSKAEMQAAIGKDGMDFIALCRPFIAEPNLVGKLKSFTQYVSKCTNCNGCAVMCDSESPTKCYKNSSYENKRKNL